MRSLIFRHLGQLILGAEDVRVVLREAAHAHQAVQRAGRLVAMHVAEFGQPDRQVAVALQAVLEDLHMAGAVHRLEREDRWSARRRGRRPADFTANMFSRYQPQWPEVSHSDLSSICGALTS
jgi:hypothetical protein